MSVAYELTLGVGELLEERGFPAPVLYGPEYAKREGYDNAIVVSYDRGAPDSYDTPRGAKTYPRTVFSRTSSVVVEIYARSSRPGAALPHHESLCDQLVEGYLAAAYEWSAQALRWPLVVRAGRFLSADERSEEQTWPGAVYELRHDLVRHVRVVNFEGEGPTRTTITAVESRTDAKMNQGDTPVTGCGA